MELMETIDVYNFKTDLVYLPLLSQVFCEHLGHMSVWELFWCFEWTCHEIVVRHNCKTFTLLNLSRALPASWHHCSFTRGVLIILNMFRSRVCYCILFFEVQPPCTLWFLMSFCMLWCRIVLLVFKHVQTDFPNYIHIQHDFDRPAWNCKFAGQSWIWTAMVTWVLEIVHEAEHVFPGRVKMWHVGSSIAFWTIL